MRRRQMSVLVLAGGSQQRDQTADLILPTFTGSLRKSQSRIFLGCSEMETHRGSVHLFVFGCFRQREAGSSSTMLFFSEQTQKIRRGSSERKAVGAGRSRARGKAGGQASRQRSLVSFGPELIVAHSVVRRLPSSRPCSGLLPSPPFFCALSPRCFRLLVLEVAVENLGRIAGALAAGWTRESELSSHQVPHPRRVRINPPS